MEIGSATVILKIGSCYRSNHMSSAEGLKVAVLTKGMF